MADRTTDFVKKKRAKQIADRAILDERFKDNPLYKRQVFEFEKPGFQQTSSAPISKATLAADPSIVTADKPRILTAEQVQSNIDVSDPLKRAANIAKVQTQVSDAKAQRQLVNPDSPIERDNTADLIAARDENVITNKEELDSKLVSANRKRAIDSLNAQFAKSSGRLNQEEEAIAGNFRTAEAGVRTRDTLNRAGKGKFLDIGGLGRSGQVGQSAIAQNIATQGALGQLNQQELAQRGDIERRRSELVLAREQGIADFETDAEIKSIESQLRSQEANAEYDRERAILVESREYDEYLRGIELANDAELLQEKNRLDRENTILDAEIAEAVANNDLVREIELTKEKAILDLQSETLKQSGRLELEGKRQSGQFGLESRRQEGQLTLEDRRAANTQAEIAARGEQARITDAAQAELKGEEDGVADRFPDSVFTSNIGILTKEFDEFTPVEEVRETVALGLIDQVNNGNIVNDTQLQRLLIKYNLTEGDIDAIIEAENQRKTDRITSQLDQ
jgi:hypothetical protein